MLIIVCTHLSNVGFLKQKLVEANLTTGKVWLMSPVVIAMSTRASLAVETKGVLLQWLAHLNNKSNVCEQISHLSILVFKEA